MKSGELVVIVDSVETAVRFYTEKMGFDIVELKPSDSEDKSLGFVQLKKGKCSVIFRLPFVQEYAEFSFIKRCLSRCVGLQVEIKTGIDTLFDKLIKKDVDVVQPLGDDVENGIRSCVFRDPFGIKIKFVEHIQKVAQADKPYSFFGCRIDPARLTDLDEAEKLHLEEMVNALKAFAISRRSAKKFAKSALKNLVK